MRHRTHPVSSGRTEHYRLSRCGDRAANAALHHIATGRMTYDPTTGAYRDTHLAPGWTNNAVYRALERAVARDIYRALTGRCDVPHYQDLRPTRQAKNITLTRVAQHFARLAHAHLHHRARHPTRRPAGHRLPRLARRSFTTNRNIILARVDCTEHAGGQRRPAQVSRYAVSGGAAS